MFRFDLCLGLRDRSQNPFRFRLDAADCTNLGRNKIKLLGWEARGVICLRQLKRQYRLPVKFPRAISLHFLCPPPNSRFKTSSHPLDVKVQMDFACESERWKQVNLVTNVFGRKNRNACLFDDVTTMASSEFRTCVRHSHEKGSPCDASQIYSDTYSFIIYIYIYMIIYVYYR